MRRTDLVTGVLLLLCSCAGGSYRGVGHTTEQAAGCGLSAGQPNGPIGFDFLRFETYQAPGATVPVKAIHMVVLVTNPTDTDRWALDAKSLSLTFADGARSEAISANPVDLEIEPGQRIGMDVYFALPPEFASRRPASGFVFHYLMKMPGRACAEAIPFQRDPYSSKETGLAPEWAPLFNGASAALFGPEWGIL